MIGLSLSLCIKDVIAGKINPLDVDRIYTATHATNEREWRQVIKQYQELYWQADPRWAKRLVQRLRQKGKIIQLRELGLIPSYGHNEGQHWVPTEDGFHVNLYWEERRKIDYGQ